MAAFRRGDLADAIRAFAEAEAAYHQAGNPLQAAEMANNRSVALVQMGQGAQALEAVEGTAEVFASAGDRSRQGLALGNLASALEAAGDLDRAGDTFRLALQLFQETRNQEAEALTWQALSRLQLRQGDVFSAAASTQAALDAEPSPGLFRRILRKILGRAARLPGGSG